MKIALNEKVRVFYKEAASEGEAANIYCGVISNIGGQQRRCYLSVFMSADLSLEYLDFINYNGRSYADISIINAWLTCDMRSRPALYIRSGKVEK